MKALIDQGGTLHLIPETDAERATAEAWWSKYAPSGMTHYFGPMIAIDDAQPVQYAPWHM